MAVRFFVYATLLQGEPGHTPLMGHVPTPAKTTTGYSIVEIGPLAGLVEEGTGVVSGEVYDLEREPFMNVTGQASHAGLFQLRPVRLDDGTTAEALFLSPDQARGKRRIKGGDWRARFGGGPGGLAAGPLVSWARSRNR
ncbi:MAG: gamma-glutamylcyclotransferase [Myxococcales bacterium]|nr:gamma-glutamylcyclotransferase [Myxococcales bacterium]